MLALGVPIEQVNYLAGHKSIPMTKRYGGTIEALGDADKTSNAVATDTIVLTRPKKVNAVAYIVGQAVGGYLSQVSGLFAATSACIVLWIDCRSSINSYTFAMDPIINTVFWFVPYFNELRPIGGDLFTMWLFMLVTFAISILLYGLLNRCLLRHLKLPQLAASGPLAIIQGLLGTIFMFGSVGYIWATIIALFVLIFFTPQLA
ncbi:hypothetical protein OAF45_00095 [Candidatus Latescibacteria bacterium]|nr:hypothetical protein [Candidatus Latescibacterota bacterium]